MIDLLIDKSEYDELAANGHLTTHFAPIGRRQPEVKNAKRRFVSDCGVSAGEQRRLRYRFTPDGGKGKPKIKGGIVVVALSVALDESNNTWQVTFVKTAEKVEDYMLRRGSGYTRNPDNSCDPEVSVPYSPDIERINGVAADTQRRAIRSSLKALEAQAEALGESPEERKVKLRTKQAIARALLDLSDESEAA